jgi:hypothetical protein
MRFGLKICQLPKYCHTPIILGSIPQSRSRNSRAINQFGFLIPVLIDDQNTVLAGHARIEAAKQLRLLSVPCIRANHLSEVQKRTFIILDNRLAAEAAWDFQVLAKEVDYLHSEGIDLTTTGFDIPEIEMILGVADPPVGNSDDDRIPDLASERVVTKRRDLWILGDHRLFCGDARRRESFAAVLLGTTAQLVFVDPPYNVKIRGHVSQRRGDLCRDGNPTARQREDRRLLLFVSGKRYGKSAAGFGAVHKRHDVLLSW